MNKILAFLIIIIFTGCSQTFSTMQHSNLETSIQLDKSQYEIVGDIRGSADVTYIFIFFGWFPFGFESNYGQFELHSGRFVRFRGLFPQPEQNAIYNAIRSAKGVDAIITPKFNTEYSWFGFPFFFKKSVRVTGKGIKIKDG